jgi:hypothetical protein
MENLLRRLHNMQVLQWLHLNLPLRGRLRSEAIHKQRTVAVRMRLCECGGEARKHRDDRSTHSCHECTNMGVVACVGRVLSLMLPCLAAAYGQSHAMRKCLSSIIRPLVTVAANGWASESRRAGMCGGRTGRQGGPSLIDVVFIIRSGGNTCGYGSGESLR